MAEKDEEEQLLRSVALQNAQSILLARQRAERELIEAQEALTRKSEELAMMPSVVGLQGRAHHRERPGTVADSARVMQILWNLLKNSIKFTAEGGTITVRSRLNTSLAPAEATIEVADNGIGINETHLPRVFEAFEQGDRRITRQFGGLGLGLAITNAIAESHGGRLTAASAGVGRGSTFTFRSAGSATPS